MTRAVLIAVAVLGLAAGAGAGDLEAPFVALCAGAPIDVDVGHAAPCFFDLNADGRPDLLVGQFGQGKLRIYLNEGEAGKPVFTKFTWLQAGGADGKVPSG